MLYIIENQKLGKDQAENTAESTIHICTKPAVNHDSLEEQITGFCGTTGLWRTIAHGEHETLVEAEYAVKSLFLEAKEYDIQEMYDETMVKELQESGTLAVFKKSA